MDELTQRVLAARSSLSDPEAKYDDAWIERQASTFQRRRTRRTRSLPVAKAAAAASLTLLVILGVHRYRRIDTPALVAQHTAPEVEPLTIDDGSTVTPFDIATVFNLKEASAERAVVELVSGGARFRVAHRAERAFHVEAGPVLVEVLGTEFTVERIAERVRVSVLTGQVQVTAGGRTSQLVEGDTGIFPHRVVDPLSTRESAANDRQDPALSPERPLETSTPLRAHGPDVRRRTPSHWRALAAGGKLGDAYQELERDGWSIPSDPASLLLAADVARRTHHPAQAVAPLRRMLQAYPQDPRASAAAFTLGRVLMDTGAYRDAASSFATAWSIEPDGVIAEDAAAREVEALSRAGDRARAQERASAYAARYPKGRRLDAVRRYGGLE